MATTRAAMAQWARGSREGDSSRARDTLVHVTNHESLDGCPQRACQQAGPGVPLEKRLRCMDSVVAASPPRPYICTILVQMHQDGAAPERGDEGALAVAAGALEPASGRGHGPVDHAALERRVHLAEGNAHRGAAVTKRLGGLPVLGDAARHERELENAHLEEEGGEVVGRRRQ